MVFLLVEATKPLTSSQSPEILSLRDLNEKEGSSSPFLQPKRNNIQMKHKAKKLEIFFIN
jgi:hypothetical protein